MCNAKDCEQYHPDNICCTCQNLEWYKLRQILADIKEIVDICCKTTDCAKCKFFAICENNCVDVILQKLSEVEDEITTR